MPKIQVMNPYLSNKIAAGEVVERPASVVKELVENAIDANSKHIQVYVEEGGIEKIQVMDNGNGMEREDALLAIERHATSKLLKEQDLFRISTLGFRGEALPSIASVAQLTLQTWDGMEETGTKIMVQGGEVKLVEDAPLRQGTIIEVTQLFYNTPARYKYLKSTHTELSHISDYMNRLALAYPSISFTFMHNNKTLLMTTGNGSLLSVMAAIYGRQIAQKMIPFSARHIDFEVEGLLGQPDISRSSRQYISILINGRYVKSYALQQAVQRAYHTRLPIHRFPILVLSLKMDPSLVDVNVHPAKLEVRISKEKELSEWLEQELKSILTEKQEIPNPLSSTFKKAKETMEQQQIQFQLPDPKPDHQFIRENGVEQKESLKPSPRPSLPPDNMPLQRDNEVEATIPPKRMINASAPVEQRNGLQRNDEQNNAKQNNKQQQIPLLFPLGQLHGTYILAQNENGLYMIDQHAAQERIWYEYFYQQLNRPKQENQDLLVPIVIECTAGEAAIVQEGRQILAEIGLFLEEFGHHAYMIRSHPVWFPSGEEELLIREIIDYILQGKKALEWIVFREKVAIMMSCKQAIKANRYLTQAEMEGLLEQLRKTTNPFTCPHGRPITILLTTYEIEKMFKRVM